MPKCNFFAKVPNDEEGKLFLLLLGKYLNKESYRITKRGRNPDNALADKDGLKRGYNRFQSSVPKRYARAFNLYLHVKPVVIDEHEYGGGVVGVSTYIAEQRAWRRARNATELLGDYREPPEKEEIQQEENSESIIMTTRYAMIMRKKVGRDDVA